AFARLLLTKPKAVFADEATSAMDEGLELTMCQLVRNELPDTILVSVSHRSTVEPHHQQRLRLLGQGRWELGRVEKEPAGVYPEAYAPPALRAACAPALGLSAPTRPRPCGPR